MAKTMYTINLNYQKTLQQVNRLEEAASSISKEIKELQAIRNRINAAWTGENASNYLRKILKIESDLSKLQKRVNNAADAVRKAAKETYDAEKAAVEIAQKIGSMGGR